MVNYFRLLYYLQSLNRSAYSPPSEIARRQEKRLRFMIQYAHRNVPYYHERFKKIEIRSNDAAGSKTLQKLPILRKNDLQNHASEFISREYCNHRLKKLHTSGSTGRPLSIYISSAEDDCRKARHVRANEACGQKLRDKWVLLTSPRHTGSTGALQNLLGIFVANTVSVFEDAHDQFLEVRDMRPDVLDGYPSSLWLLAREAKRESPGGVSPRIIISGGEAPEKAHQEYVEHVFQALCHDQYSCMEFDRVSWQCEKREGYHIDAESLIVESVDKEGNQVAPGETGEIVCTSLFNYAMPMIRYALDDVGSLSNDECSCGRSLPLMKTIEGRCDSLVMVPNDRAISPRVLGIALGDFGDIALVDQYKIVQKKIDLFEIYVKTIDRGVDHASLGQSLRVFLKKTLPFGMQSEFSINFVKSIPLEKTGKLMKFTSEVSDHLEN